MIHIFALILTLFSSPALAQCVGEFPPGTFCGNPGPGAGSPRPITATAGTIFAPGSTTIGDIATWNNTNGTLLADQAPTTTMGWTPATNIGVDCTAATDSTSALQTWINAHLAGGHLRFPSGCHLKTSSTLTITDAVNIVFEGAGIAGPGANPPVQWDWVGTNGGSACTLTYASCVFVMDFEHTDHPTVQNIWFNSASGSNCPDGFLKFDGNAGAHIGTSGRVLHNTFANGVCQNANFIAVDIAHTAANNHENYIVFDNFTTCNNVVPSRTSTTAITNSTTALTDSGTPYNAGMVGHRVRISYDNNSNPGNHQGTTGPFSRGYFDTTVAAFVSSSQLTLAVAVPFTANPVTVVIDGGFGTAYRNGSSQNAIQQVFSNLQYFGCQYGVFILGGGAQVNQLTSGFSDVGMFVSGFVSQNTTLDYYAAENDVTAVVAQNGAVAPIEISNSRLSNGTSNANGFLQLGGMTLLRNNLVNVGTGNSNAVLIGPYASIGVYALGTVTGGSGYTPGTYTGVTLVGGAHGSGPKATIVVGGGGAVSTVTITDQGGGGFPVPGDVLSTANTNIGGTGSGFSVPIAATSSPASLGGSPDAFGTLMSYNNNWVQGCCGQAIDTAHLGMDQFQQQNMPTSINDVLSDFNRPQKQQLGCSGTTSIGCFVVNDLVDNGANGVGIAVNMGNNIIQSNNTVAFRSISQGGIGYNIQPGSVSHIGFQMYPPLNGGVTTLTGFDAAWNVSTLQGGTTVYGFRAETPASVNFGPIANVYGFECDRQKIASGVTNGWCFYNANANDQNFFAGPTLLGNNGLTVPAGGLGLAKITADGVAPGAAGAKLEVVCGTNAGTAKIIAYAGTSATPVTVLDNIGSGVTGC